MNIGAWNVLETVLIATYAPTDNSVINIKENYQEQLAEELDKVKNYQEVILAGDLMEEWD